jgi:hypothetical protein
MANDIFRLLQIATKGNHFVQDNIPTKASDRTDPFEDKKNGENIVIMKTKFILRGYGGKVRRAYAKCPNASEYRYVGWVFDDDVQSCMICGVDFSFLVRRHHCRVCGDIICSSCSTGTVRIKELPDFDRVRACDSCYIGQEEISIKPESPLPLQIPQFNPPPTQSSEQSRANASRNQQNRRNSLVGTRKTDNLAGLQKQVYRYQVVVLIVYVFLYVIVLQINK